MLSGVAGPRPNRKGIPKGASPLIESATGVGKSTLMEYCAAKAKAPLKRFVMSATVPTHGFPGPPHQKESVPFQRSFSTANASNRFFPCASFCRPNAVLMKRQSHLGGWSS